ncbi:MAG TPA: S1/P1 nuclease [Accumulibacter sp.]|jgi:hypothetical protein|nr:S1/P1 nuclease [Accumulibacter sp.]
MNRWRILPCSLFLLIFSWPVFAWNAAGHRLIARIAWQQLDGPSRAATGKLLRQHPDYPHWQTQGQEDDQDLNAFVEASTWPDDIRHDARFYSVGETPTPTLPGFPDMERRRHWHYVDRPIPPDSRSQPSDGVLDKQLLALIDAVGWRGTPLAKRAYALPWLIHLVGDAHQPLHAASRYAKDGRSDRGGNEVTIDNPFATAHEPADNLHRYWDGLSGAPWLRGESLAQRADALIRRYPLGQNLISIPATQWLHESWRIAERDAYPPGNAKVPTISTEFDTRSKEIANQRIVLAGCRLADLLRRLLRDSGLR